MAGRNLYEKGSPSLSCKKKGIHLGTGQNKKEDWSSRAKKKRKNDVPGWDWKNKCKRATASAFTKDEGRADCRYVDRKREKPFSDV